MADRPLVLVHGYSDSAEGFGRWRKIIHAWGNEVTLKDVAEAWFPKES